MGRITIVFDNNLEKRIRLIQAEILKKTNKSCSFSKVVNLVVEEGLKVFKA